MDKDKKFILTQDEKVAKELIDSGFLLVQETSDMWTFMNCDKLTFSNYACSNSIYSDVIVV